MGIKLDQLFNIDKELFQRIFNNIADGVVVADANGEFLFFNNAAEKILGIGIKEINQEEWSEVYGCFCIDQITPFPSKQLPLAQTLKTGKTIRKQVFIKNEKRPQGVFIEISSNPVVDTDNVILGGVVVFKDLTESKNSETEICQSEERLKAQFMGFPLPTYVWQHADGDFIMIDHNIAADVITEGKVKELIGIKCSELYPNQLDQIHSDFRNCFKNKKIISREMTYQFQTTEKLKNLKVHYVYIPPDLVVVHTEDITDQKNAEMYSQKLSSAVEQTADAVLISDKEGIIEYVNAAFETMTGYKKEETVGKTPRILNSGKHKKVFYQSLWQTLLAGNPYRGEMVNKKKDGENFWVQNTITPIKDKNSRVTNFVSVIKDITDIKAKKEQEIRLQIAKEIQQRLYPSNVHIPGFDISGKNYPADETGGDYFDIIVTSDGNLWLTIADVSDHGMGPALIMAETRAYLRAFIETSLDPAKILEKLNNVLFSDLTEYQYVTLMLICINTVNNEIEYSGAGHIPGYLLNSRGEVAHILESTGIPLGYRNNQHYNNSKISNITSGNILTLWTDGVVEAHDGNENEFGYERIINLINEHRNDTSDEIINHIYQDVCCFSHRSRPEDDITTLICKM